MGDSSADEELAMVGKSQEIRLQTYVVQCTIQSRMELHAIDQQTSSRLWNQSL
jgi:hypothetical protein